MGKLAVEGLDGLLLGSFCPTLRPPGAHAPAQAAGGSPDGSALAGITGDELCPDVFFTDVLTGREIRNHFNVWQMHIAPDVVTTIARYVDITGDTEYLIEYGAEIGRAIVNFTNAMDLLRIEEHSLGDRGLSGIYVGNYANIAGTL